jgi:hypothetical protein
MAHRDSVKSVNPKMQFEDEERNKNTVSPNICIGFRVSISLFSFSLLPSTPLVGGWKKP